MVEKIRVGVLTVSDRCSSGEQEDISGKEVQSALPADDYVVALYAVVPDEKKIITDTLKRWVDVYDCDLILTTGGTGFSKRDVTPEATLRVIERTTPGIVQLLLAKGIKSHPFAALSRPVAGIRGETIIVNLPGSPGGAKDGVKILLPLIPHALNVLKGEPMTDHVTDNP